MLGAVLLDRALGLVHLGAQGVDLGLEPLAGLARRVTLGRLLHVDVAVGDRIGDARGKFGIFRRELDRDDPRLLYLVDSQALIVLVEYLLVVGHARRIARNAEQRQDPRKHGGSAVRIEFRQRAQLQVGDDLAAQVGRQDELDLAADRFLVEQRALLHRRRRPRVGGLLIFDEELRGGAVERRHPRKPENGERGGDDYRQDDPEPGAPQGGYQSTRRDARRRTAGRNGLAGHRHVGKAAMRGHLGSNPQSIESDIRSDRVTIVLIFRPAASPRRPFRPYRVKLS